MVDTNETNEKVQVQVQINESKVTEETKVEDRLKENNVTQSEVSFLLLGCVLNKKCHFWHFSLGMRILGIFSG